MYNAASRNYLIDKQYLCHKSPQVVPYVWWLSRSKGGGSSGEVCSGLNGTDVLAHQLRAGQIGIGQFGKTISPIFLHRSGRDGHYSWTH